MTQHIRIPCPKCQQSLKVRTEYVGKWITCKHCAQTFKPKETDPAVSAALAALTTPDADPAPPAPAQEPQRVQALEDELRQLRVELKQVRAELATRTSEYNASVRFLQESQEQQAQLLAEAQELQAQVERATARQPAGSLDPAPLRERVVLLEESLAAAATAQEASLERLRASLTAAEAERDRLREERAWAQKQFDMDRDALRQKIDALMRERESDLYRWRGTELGLTSEIDRLKHIEEVVRRQENNYKNKIATLQQELTNARTAAAPPPPVPSRNGTPGAPEAAEPLGDKAESAVRKLEEEKNSLADALRQARREADYYKMTLEGMGIQVEES